MTNQFRAKVVPSAATFAAATGSPTGPARAHTAATEEAQENAFAAANRAAWPAASRPVASGPAASAKTRRRKPQKATAAPAARDAHCASHPASPGGPRCNAANTAQSARRPATATPK